LDSVFKFSGTEVELDEMGERKFIFYFCLTLSKDVVPLHPLPIGGFEKEASKNRKMLSLQSF
jgi:hypothetical protein